MSNFKQQNSYPLRMPEELRERLETMAKANGRSLNAEIVAILQAAADGQQGQFNMEKFSDELAEKIAKRLKRQ